MSTELATRDNAALIEKVLLTGDLKDLTATERVQHYRAVCESLGLNPLTKPFEYLALSGKLTLYARKDATDQLRDRHKVSVDRLEHSAVDEAMASGLYVVTAYAVDGSGRRDSSTGVVAIKGLQGEALANALMKAETKAKRRVTLSICGLGWLDETEVADIPETDTRVVDVDTGELLAVPPSKPAPKPKPGPMVAESVAPDTERAEANAAWKRWATVCAEKGWSPLRLRYYLGQPNATGVTGMMLLDWRAAHPDHGYDTLIALAVEGETAQQEAADVMAAPEQATLEVE